MNDYKEEYKHAYEKSKAFKRKYGAISYIKCHIGALQKLLSNKGIKEVYSEPL